MVPCWQSQDGGLGVEWLRMETSSESVPEVYQNPHGGESIDRGGLGGLCLQYRTPNQFGDLGDDGVSESGKTVHPIAANSSNASAGVTGRGVR